MPRVEMMHIHLRSITLHRFRAEPRRAHEARDPASAHGPARVAQQLIETWAAVAFLMCIKETFDLRREESVLFRMGTLTTPTPGIEAGRRHGVAPAQRRDAEVRALRVDEGERVAFRAEQNRMAFFKSSCSSSNSACAFSRASS
jgi:hypothetical protein